MNTFEVHTVDQLRIERVVTSGTFDIDGGSWPVDNNVWLVGDDSEVVVIDAAHSAAAILDAVAARDVRAIVCTHGHNDHIGAAVDLASATDAPVYLHPGDDMLWRSAHAEYRYRRLEHDQVLRVAGGELRVVHSPGHSPGSVCLYAPDVDVLFSGDTLFPGGPGATNRSYGDFLTIVDSLRCLFFDFPGPTRVYPGHGDTTNLNAERPELNSWVQRGY
ncbi:MBL fold metallo-hydrolase [Nocardia sp. NPDC004654]|uniref:MBL fold metallo-hydrolase n=1 Tax=Nocardia sp. NPDC004654 TaxID=3154776 RepID=UPI0033BB85A4